MGGTYDLVLTNRIWQRWWDVTPIIRLVCLPTYVHIWLCLVSMHLRDSSNNLKETSCYDINCPWRASHNRKIWVVSKNWGPQSYTCKELNSEFCQQSYTEEEPEFKMRMWLADTLIAALNRGTSELCPDFWATETEMINLCCFKLQSL